MAALVIVVARVLLGSCGLCFCSVNASGGEGIVLNRELLVDFLNRLSIPSDHGVAGLELEAMRSGRWR